MWNFLCSLSLVTKIIASIVSVAAIGGCIYALIRHFTGWKDRGFMKDEKGNSIHWELEHLPVLLHYPESMPTAALGTMRAAIREINKLIGSSLYDLGTPIELFRWNKLRASWLSGRCSPGAILVEVINSDDDHGGSTELRWGENGELVCGYIRINMTHCANGTVWGHELGHGAGLAHDNDFESMMSAKVIARPQNYTQADIYRLQEVCKKGTE